MTEMTKRDALVFAQNAIATIETAEATEAWNKIQKMIDQLDAAKLRDRKPSKAVLEKRAANASLGETFRGYVAEHDSCTVADIIANVPEAKELSVSKVASVLRATEGITRTEVKRKGYYHVA